MALCFMMFVVLCLCTMINYSCCCCLLPCYVLCCACAIVLVMFLGCKVLGFRGPSGLGGGGDLSLKQGSGWARVLFSGFGCGYVDPAAGPTPTPLPTPNQF